MIGSAAPTTRRFGSDVLLDRIRRASQAAGERAIDALLVTPSKDYAYLLGYHAPPLERLTCLVVPAEADPFLVLPRLEEPLARHQLGELADELTILAWDETDDPYRLLQSALGGVLRVGVQDQMWARFALRLRAALDPAEMVEAAGAMSALRSVKSPEEVDRLRLAAQAADRAMLAVAQERVSGRSEAELSRWIRDVLVAEGHDRADFAIVASGPNAASPHHEPGDRLIEPGDALVLDIGGTLAGYCSDTTRTAFVGEPPADFVALYAVLRAAQAAACDAVAPGVRCRDVDAAARDVITEAGYGDAFIHRTGHGIGLEAHEEPYIVASNDEPLVAGNAFSVEPGIYVRNAWGARIEDIVVCTQEGGERLNTMSTELLILE